MAAYGAGILAGSLAVTAVPLRREPEADAAGWAAAMAAALALTAAVGSYGLAVAAFALAGLVTAPQTTATLAARGHYAPDAARAQMFVTLAGLKVAAAAAGTAIAGAALALGPRPLALAGAALIAATVAATAADRRRAPAGSSSRRTAIRPAERCMTLRTPVRQGPAHDRSSHRRHLRRHARRRHGLLARLFRQALLTVGAAAVGGPGPPPPASPTSHWRSSTIGAHGRPVPASTTGWPSAALSRTVNRRAVTCDLAVAEDVRRGARHAHAARRRRLEERPRDQRRPDRPSRSRRRSPWRTSSSPPGPVATSRIPESTGPPGSSVCSRASLTKFAWTSVVRKTTLRTLSPQEARAASCARPRSPPSGRTAARRAAGSGPRS